MGYSRIAALFTVVVVLLVASRAAEGQTTASCAQNLAPCGMYLNSTRPPNSCCDPLRETVTNDLPCLCNLYQTPGFLETLGVNLTQALQLSRNCGIPGDLSACRAAAPASPNAPPPPGVPGNDVARIGTTGLFSFLLVCASIMLY